jgi:hypothetical protein
MESRTFALAVLAAASLAPAGCLIPEPGVRAGRAAVQSTRVCEPRGIGSILTLEWLPAAAAAPEDDGRLWIGGEHGAIQSTRYGEELERVEFDVRNGNPRPVDVDADGALETMNASRGWSDAGLFDSTGRALWSFPPDGLDAADAMAAGPIGEDGATAFVVGLNASGGVHFLDAEGYRFRSIRSSNVFSVAIADLDGDGTVEIVHSDGRGFFRWLQVRDEYGCPLRRLNAPFEGFGLIRWPDAQSPPRLIGGDEDTVQVFDPCVEPEGALLAEFELPDDGFSVETGQLVRLDPAAEPYLAVLRTIRATLERSALYVFDSRRRLVYHEVFGVPYLGLTVAPAAAPGTPEELLVGAGTSVWRYALRSPAAEPVAR